jgi:hypothetical protein
MTMIHWIVLGGLGAVVVLSWAFWRQIRGLFADSETLWLARMQMAVGVLMQLDLTPIIPSKYLGIYVVISGLLTEMARRSRTKKSTEVLPSELEPDPKPKG